MPTLFSAVPLGIPDSGGVSRHRSKLIEAPELAPAHPVCRRASASGRTRICFATDNIQLQIMAVPPLASSS